MNKCFFVFLMGLFACSSAYAQAVIRSSLSVLGSSVVEGEMLLRQTVGQAAPVGVGVHEQLALRQGFQQPVGKWQKGSQQLGTFAQVDLFPNPNPGVFMVHVHEKSDKPFRYQIFNSTGTRVGMGVLQGEEQSTIRCEHCTPGLYLLHIIHSDYVHQALRFIIH